MEIKCLSKEYLDRWEHEASTLCLQLKVFVASVPFTFWTQREPNLCGCQLPESRVCPQWWGSPMAGPGVGAQEHDRLPSQAARGSAGDRVQRRCVGLLVLLKPKGRSTVQLSGWMAIILPWTQARFLHGKRPATAPLALTTTAPWCQSLPSCPKLGFPLLSHLSRNQLTDSPCSPVPPCSAGKPQCPVQSRKGSCHHKHCLDAVGVPAIYTIMIRSLWWKHKD